MARFKQWLQNIAIKDPVEREQALLLQKMLIGLALAAILVIPLEFGLLSFFDAVRSALNSVVTIIALSIALWVLRKGNLRLAVLIICTAMLLAFAVTTFTVGVARSTGLTAFMMPITLAGLLTGRRGILFIAGLSAVIVIGLGILEATTVGIVGQFPRQNPLLLVVFTFVFSCMVVAFLFHRFSARLRIALDQALSREEELKQIRDRLEILVDERTAALAERTVDLEAALHTVEDREQALARFNTELAAAKSSAEEANRLKSRFLANMSHELRTPLNSIINFTRIMMTGMVGPVTDEQTDFLNRVRHSGEHLLGLINDILDLSKIEAGRMDLYRESVDLLALINSVMATATGLIKDHDLTLELEAPAELPPVLIDKTRIRQVLLNLLSNAAKFTREGGITVRVAPPSAGQVWVAVQDTGIGIPPEYLPKVFDEFQQVDNDLSREQTGTGLGLPITKRLVELHGGQMRLESAPGQGSTFSFSLPCVAPAAHPEARQAPSVDEALAADPGPIDIVVVDDDPDAHKMLQVMLQGAGYRIFSVYDSRQALSAIARLRPRLVITDLEMPHINGWEVLAQLKHDPALAPIPVLICSVIDPSTVGLVLGARKHIVKPIDEESLLAVVAECARATANVLIVDDNADSRTIMRNILGHSGYTIAEAENGREGMAAIAAQTPDLILLDLMMPEMDGFEVLAELRATPEYAEVPVIIVSAQDLTFQEHEWLLNRSQGVVAKHRLSETEFLEQIKYAFSPAASNPS